MKDDAAHIVEQCTTSFLDALSQPIRRMRACVPPTLLAGEPPVPGGGWGGWRGGRQTLHKATMGLGMWGEGLTSPSTKRMAVSCQVAWRAPSPPQGYNAPQAGGVAGATSATGQISQNRSSTLSLPFS